VNAYHRRVADLPLEISENPESTLRHVSLTFHARGEVPETDRHQLVQHTLTRLRPLHRRHLSAVDSVVVAGGVTSNFVVVAAAGEISTIVTCSEETALLQFRDGQEIREKFLARPVNQKGGMSDALTDETRNADPTGPTESVMSNAQEEIHHSLASAASTTRESR
jgi:hypothetical protein